MPIHELAALGAALTWAFAGLVSLGPSRAMGAFAFSRWRMSMVFVMLAVTATVMGTWSTVPSEGWALIAISGIVGIFLGDTALFLTLNRLGPRATAILFAGNAPLTVLLGWLLLGETLAAIPLLGAGIAFGGIVLAILFGKSRKQSDRLEETTGPLWIGVACGAVAALCQAGGTLLLRPVMAGDFGGGVPDPIAVSAVRVGLAALALIVVGWLPFGAVKCAGPLTARNLGLTALSGFMAMGVGMTLLVFALSGGPAGIVATLSATTPVLILPVLWIVSRQVPAPGAWVGAGFTVLGTAMIFLG